MRVRRAVGVVLAVPVVAVTLLATTAAAQPSSDDRAGDDRRPHAALTLSIVPERTVALATSVADRPSRVTLTCRPNGGSHPTPDAACASLAAVGGSFERLPPVADTMCPMVYAPVRVEASGYWGDRMVRYSAVFGNRCFAAVGTDGVFSF